VSDCQHVIVEGLELSGGPECNNGLFIRKGSEYVEASNLDIHDSRQTGIKCHTLQKDAPADWVQRGIYIHDCHVHDCGTEAMYIGHASTQNNPTCHADGLIVEDCEISNCGWGGIQIRNASEVLVRGNDIYNCGLEVDANHAGGGLNIGPEVSGAWCENEIENCERGVHLLHWDGLVELHHNLLVRNGLHGPKGEQPSIRGMGDGLISFHHNTVALGGDPRAIQLPDATGEIYDNILAEPEGTNAPGCSYHHNTACVLLTSVRFVDPYHGNWALQEDSPAVGADSAGGDCGAFGMQVVPGPEPPPEPPPVTEGKRVRALFQVLDEGGDVVETFTIEGKLERVEG